MMKGYAGGLVRFRRIGRLHIGSLGACPDDVSVSFTVCWVSCSLWDGCTTDDDVWSGLEGLDDVQRFDVKNLSFGTGFNLRV